MTPIEVRWRAASGVWVATSAEGDYGLAPTQYRAADIAIDAASTTGPWSETHRTLRLIRVYAKDDTLMYTIRATRRAASSQLFQDATP